MIPTGPQCIRCHRTNAQKEGVGRRRRRLGGAASQTPGHQARCNPFLASTAARRHTVIATDSRNPDETLSGHMPLLGLDTSRLLHAN